MDSDSLAPVRALPRFENAWQPKTDVVFQKGLAYELLGQVDGLGNHLERVLLHERVVSLHEEQQPLLVADRRGRVHMVMHFNRMGVLHIERAELEGLVEMHELGYFSPSQHSLRFPQVGVN